MIGADDDAYYTYLSSFLAECEATDESEGRDPRYDDDAIYDRVSAFTELASEVLNQQLGGSSLRLEMFSSEVVRRFYGRSG